MAATVVVPGPSGAAVTVHAAAPVCASSRSKRQWRRGKLSPSAPQVWARVRGQRRLLVEQLGGPVAHAAGLDQQDLGVGGQQVGEERARRRRATAARTPCRRRSCPRRGAPTARGPTGRHRRGCGRPLGDRPRRRAAPGSRRARRTSRSACDRWSPTENSVSRSTSSPHRSMRTGPSAVAGRRRRSSPARPARRGARPGTPGGSRPATRRSTSSSGSTCVALAHDDRGQRPRRRDRGAGAGRGPAPRAPAGIRSSADASRQVARSRRPMVSTLGLTRSNGSVSHAGNRSTCSAPRKAPRSWARRSASAWSARRRPSGGARGPGQAGDGEGPGRLGDGDDGLAERRRGRRRSGRFAAAEGAARAQPGWGAQPCGLQ